MFHFKTNQCSRDSSVSIETGKGIDIRGFLSCTSSRLALRPTQSPIHSVNCVKRLGRDADHSPPSSVEVKNGGAIPPLPDISSWHRA
jgi:hypothetical protein